jgi:hypothetical protein
VSRSNHLLCFIMQRDEISPRVLAGSNGFVGQPITDTTVAIPDKLSIAQGRLIWSNRGGLKQLTEPATEEVLDAFLELATHEEGILKFAQRYGPLWLCERHGIVAWHRPILQFRNAFGPAPVDDEEVNLRTLWCPPSRDPKQRFYEPIERWRALAMRARNLLQITAQMRAGEILPRDAWKAVDGSSENFAGVWSRLENSWDRLQENLGWWLEVADVTSAIQFDNHNLRLTLGARTIPSPLSIVALHLVLAAAGAEGLFNCAACGVPFLASQPLRGEQKRPYCARCRKKGRPNRDAQRDWRANHPQGS